MSTDRPPVPVPLPPDGLSAGDWLEAEDWITSLQDLLLAAEMGARAEDLRHSIHAHTTLSETVREAAELHAATSAHFFGRG